MKVIIKGKQGEGKSLLASNILRQFIDNGKRYCDFDPCDKLSHFEKFINQIHPDVVLFDGIALGRLDYIEGFIDRTFPSGIIFILVVQS